MNNYFFNTKLSTRFLLVFLTIPFVFLWCELYTRILFPQNLDSKKDFYSVDPVVGFIHKPTSIGYEKGREYNVIYKINSIGLRDREYGPKDDNTLRILLIGDSFCVSHGLTIEESISRQFESALQNSVSSVYQDLKIEVINGSAGGYSPYNYWKAYLRWKPILNPDIVIVGLSPDDYDSTNAFLQYDIQNGSIVGMYKAGSIPLKNNINYIKKTRKWLSWNSHIYILFRNYFYYNDFVGKFSLWFSKKGQKNTNQLKQYMVPLPSDIEENWNDSFSYLYKLHQATTNDGIKLVCLSIPLKEEIDQPTLLTSLSSSGLNESQIDINQTLKKISAFCKENNIELLDPRPALISHHKKIKCYFSYDGHWNSDGTHFASIYLSKQWRDLKLPPWDLAP